MLPFSMSAGAFPAGCSGSCSRRTESTPRSARGSLTNDYECDSAFAVVLDVEGVLDRVRVGGVAGRGLVRVERPVPDAVVGAAGSQVGMEHSIGGPPVDVDIAKRTAIAVAAQSEHRDADGNRYPRDRNGHPRHNAAWPLTCERRHAAQCRIGLRAAVEFRSLGKRPVARAATIRRVKTIEQLRRSWVEAEEDLGIEVELLPDAVLVIGFGSTAGDALCSAGDERRAA